MPKTEKAPQRKTAPRPLRGRPPGPPKRTTSIHMDEDLYVWMSKNVPPEQSLSSFVCDAVRREVERIERTRRP